MKPSLLSLRTSTSLLLLTLAGLLATPTSAAAQAEVPAYRDPACPREKRIEDLLARLTLEEKASLMSNSTPGVPRLGIPKYDWWSEALHGVANAGNATVFPQAIGLAAMWDEKLHRQIAEVIGTEGRAKFNGYAGTPAEGTIFHGLTFWSPNINIFRDPRWGRGQETYGEDPFLTSRLGVAFVRGLQGQDPNYLQAAACAKHFAVHSGPESLRHVFNATPTPEDLHDTYLPAFEALVREAKVEIVMTAYNAIDGAPCSVNPLLYSLLSQWGFNGHITSDCGSVADLSRTFHWVGDDEEAEAMVLKSGMNVRCGSEPTALVQAVQRGLITEAEINRQVAPLLRTLLRLGLLDPKDKVPFNSISPTQNDSPSHGAVALQAARESLVLLKNNGLLPLSPATLHRVAVIGPNASSVPALVGNYNGTPSSPVTVLDGLRAALEPAGVTVDYAHGCDYSTRPAGWRPIPHPWFRGEFFANATLSGEPVAVRYDRPLCFSCKGEKEPTSTLPDKVPGQGISARWQGDLQTTLAGDYQFLVRLRGGCRLRLDNKLVLDSWSPAASEMAQERTVTVSCPLPENTTLPITLEYLQGEGPMQVGLEWNTPAVDSGMAEAVRIAGAADVVVFVGGISAQLEGEEMQVDFDGYSGGDRNSIELPELQQRLLTQLKAGGKPIIYVNLSGSAIAMPWADTHADAILQAWYPGQAGGKAVADVLLGRYNPAGRLPLTFYRATGDLPDFKNYDMAGRTYRFFRGRALYPFGHGLSYTRFNYTDLHVSKGQAGTLDVKLRVTNTGDRDGDEVVQLYAVPPSGSSRGELGSLCGFVRVHLKKGETTDVNLTVPASALRRWHESVKAYEVPAGTWILKAGASSADIRLSRELTL